MKDGARVINYARGEVVDEDAMIAALESGKIARFVSDFPTEKMVKAPNAVLTPHLGGTTGEAEANCAKMAAVQMDDYLKNGNIRNSVNFPDVTLERAGSARICLIHKNIPGSFESGTNGFIHFELFSSFPENSHLSCSCIRSIKAL